MVMTVSQLKRWNSTCHRDMKTEKQREKCDIHGLAACKGIAVCKGLPPAPADGAIGNAETIEIKADWIAAVCGLALTMRSVIVEVRRAPSPSYQ
jgi:hypothetical protein